MNLNMNQPKNITEDLLPSITKNCKTLTKQIHRKAEETLEYKMVKPKKKHFISILLLFLVRILIGWLGWLIYKSIFQFLS